MVGHWHRLLASAGRTTMISHGTILRSSTTCALALALVGSLSGCSSCGTVEVAQGDAGGDISATDSANPNQTEDAGGETETLSCPNGAPCDGTCCGDASVCRDGSCVPACEGERCGSEGNKCCTGDETCLYDQCLVPGSDCSDNTDCPDDKICDPQVERCVSDRGFECEYRPGNDVFDPEVNVAWREDGSTSLPSFHQVMMTPMVLDIDGSGTPNIVFSTYETSYHRRAVMRAIDGETFDEVFTFDDSARRNVTPGNGLAGGDIDNDGRNEIIASQSDKSGLIAFEDHAHSWQIKWTSETFDTGWVGPSIADLNADGNPEVYSGTHVLDGRSGDVLCSNSEVTIGRKDSVAVDLDDDDMLEVVSSGGAFEFEPDGSGGFDCPTYWKAKQGGGFPAVADFGTFGESTEDFGTKDGVAEVAYVEFSTSEQIKLVDGRSGDPIWSVTLPTQGHPHYSESECSQEEQGGPPTIADFDGDDEPEVATAGACFYAVFDTDGSLLWKHRSQDFSSRSTGSSVYDFQGDGAAEVVYADECFIRVFKGAGAKGGGSKVLFKRAHSSHTLREVPVIADVDKDAHAEIVLISNDKQQSVVDQCKSRWPDYEKLGGSEHGILVIEDKKNRWVSTRPVWNQHSYHVTNVCSGQNASMCPGKSDQAGAIPAGQLQHWKQPKLNTFRQNVQSEGRFDAPDLVVSDIQTTCTGEGLNIEVTVANRGRIPVPAGVSVALEAGASGNVSWLTDLQTTQRLAPGARETLTHVWSDAPYGGSATWEVRAEADADQNGDGEHNECREENNAATTSGDACACLAVGKACKRDGQCCSGTCGGSTCAGS